MASGGGARAWQFLRRNEAYREAYGARADEASVLEDAPFALRRQVEFRPLSGPSHPRAREAGSSRVCLCGCTRVGLGRSSRGVRELQPSLGAVEPLPWWSRRSCRFATSDWRFARCCSIEPTRRRTSGVALAEGLSGGAVIGWTLLRRLAGCAFAGRESNRLDRYEGFQFIASSSPGLGLAQ